MMTIAIEQLADIRGGQAATLPSADQLKAQTRPGLVNSSGTEYRQLMCLPAPQLGNDAWLCRETGASMQGQTK